MEKYMLDPLVAISQAVYEMREAVDYLRRAGGPSQVSYADRLESAALNLEYNASEVNLMTREFERMIKS